MPDVIKPAHIVAATPPPVKLEPQDVHCRLNPTTNLLELVDLQSGQVVAIQKTTDNYLLERRSMLVEHILPSGEVVLLEKGIDPSVLATTDYMRFNPYIVDLICQKIAEGGRITKICTGYGGFPTYSQLCGWRRTQPQINKQLEEAYKDRADYYKEQVLDIAEESQEAFINEARVKIDALKWMAGVDNPRYSPKAKVEATLNVPTQVIIATGIDRTPIPGPQATQPPPLQLNVTIADNGTDDGNV